MPTPHINRPLTGPHLDLFLDEIEAALQRVDDDEEADGAGNPEPLHRQDAARAALARQACQPSDLDATQRLFRAWLAAGDAAGARRALVEAGARLLPDLPAAARDAAALTLAFWRAEIASAAGDRASQRAALAEAEAAIAPLPTEEQETGWEYLAASWHSLGEHDAVRRCHAALHALREGLPEHTARRACDVALNAMRLARSHRDEGRADDARACVKQAIDALAGHADGQDVDHHDWLQLAGELVDVAPDLVACLGAHMRAAQSAGLSSALRRDAELRLARFEARALYAQGLRAAAIERAWVGRPMLTDDEGDDFSEVILGWLVEDRQLARAARLAFECVQNDRSSAAAALRVARVQVGGVDATPVDPWWHLVLALGAVGGEYSWLHKGERLSAFVERHLAAARAVLVDHPAFAVIELKRLGVNAPSERTLPLVEAAVGDPELLNGHLVSRLWHDRMKVHGLERGLAMPFVDTLSGGWGYFLGADLNQHFRDRWPEGTPWPEAEVTALAQRYYECGLSRFESFFTTGHGHCRDGDVHLYSMLCNNLAIIYRSTLQEPARAVELHRKGIGASPFAEHYDGMMRSLQAQGDKAGFVDTADTLWHFAQLNGYSRHEPARYIDDVTIALHELQRDGEIALWLQRLDEWWTSLNAQEQSDERRNQLAALTVVLAQLAHTQPEDAMLRLEPLMPDIRQHEGSFLRLAARTYERARRFDQAKAVYQEAIVKLRAAGAAEASQLQYAQDDLMRCKRVAAEGQPWWKFWA